MTCYALRAEAAGEGWSRLEGRGEQGKAVGEIQAITKWKKGERRGKGGFVKFQNCWFR